MTGQVLDVNEALDNGGTAIVPMTNTDLQAVSRDPNLVLDEAREAASALQSVIKNKKDKLVMNNKQYLAYEDWLLLGQFYNAYCRTHDAVAVELNGIKGFKARADVLDRNGVVIGGAEAYCMRDEKNWHTKPSFQLASMAQTRAGSKAMANRLRWVAVLAEYQGTPYEEMTSNETVDVAYISSKERKESKEAFAAYNQQKNDDYRGGTKITDKQAKRLFAISKSVNMPTEYLKSFVKECGYGASKDILKKDYEKICEFVQNYKPDLTPEKEEDVPI